MFQEEQVEECQRNERRWRTGLPVLRNQAVVLRELKASDAPALLMHVSGPSVLKYIAPAPPSVESFKRFIRWTRAERRKGRLLCFGVVPAGQLHPVGLIELWPVESDFSTAEWGFVIGVSVWGTGVFTASARLLLDFAFGRLGVTRLETRAVEANDRVNGALRKLGATREGTLRSGFRSGTTFMNYAMWSILASEWSVWREGVR